MSPYSFERLYVRLGKPVWFWPLVMFLIFVVLPLLASVGMPEGY